MNVRPHDWERLDEQPHADCQVYRIYKRRFRHPADAREGDFYIQESADWGLVLALTPESRIVLVRQFRFGIERLSWEPPGGVVDAGDGHVVEGALRELREETGYIGDNPRIIGWCHPNPALMTNRAHFVLVDNCRQVAGQKLDANEEIEVQTFELEEAYYMARSGEISHCVAQAALFQLHWALRV